MKLVSHALVYWLGGTFEDLCPAVPPIKEPSKAKPYVVQWSSKDWVPINVLVFAADEDEALRRVLKAVRTVRKEDYSQTKRAEDRYEHDAHARATKLLKDLKAGKLTAQVEAYDVEVVAQVSWALNDTAVG